MDIEEFRMYCLSMPNSYEGMPFNGFFRNSRSILVFYIDKKMFCMVDMDKFESCTIKCNTDTIDNLKEQYHAVDKPFNLSSKYWISIRFYEDVPDRLLKKMIRESYDLVSEGLKR